MNELEFTNEVSNWINAIISQSPGLPFSRAKCEQHKKGSLKRRDLTLLDRDRRVVLTGEVKLPYQKDGGSPYNTSLVNDARRKATEAGSPSFFTWNVNEFVLWDTDSSSAPVLQRNYRSWEVTQVHKEDHLELDMTSQAIRGWLPQFLKEYAQIIRGTSKIGSKSPDEKFIEILESSLRLPVQLTIAELDNRYKKSSLRAVVDKWMREDQGWLIRTDPEGIRDNLERASKYACYALMNRLVFYEALLKRYGDRLDKICVPSHVDTGDALHNHLAGYFDEAKKVTNDYETVFGEDYRSVGNRIPFYSDNAVSHWRMLIGQIHEFDFSKLDYEIIGSIFERLISPEEQHKFGRFYTRAEVVDLINSFCIKNGDEKIMDPACGGGTFLVRAYARKRALIPNLAHSEILRDLYGVDIDDFASHLTTINLATRNLIDEENYPQIARSDFFDVRVGRTFLKLPKKMIFRGLGKMQHRNVEIAPLDAIVGNPPYVRTQDIPKDQKEKMLTLVKEEGGAPLSARSDIHCYFWPHATSFLKDNGYLCFLTSSQWLDVEYGFRLQEWILSNFKIISIIESIDEPWFVGARVATAITILEREKNDKKRRNNKVHFVQLRRPIRDIILHDGITAGAVDAVNSFRDEILGVCKNETNERYRIRLVKQKDIMREGGLPGKYHGSKWGIHLRAPDLWFEIRDKAKDKLVALREVAEVSSGILTGKDDYFLPINCSAECLRKVTDPVIFQDTYGVPRSEVESGKTILALCGDDRGQIKPIESKYLEPEVHNLNEVETFAVSPDGLTRQVLLVGKQKEELQGTYVADYLNWGEQEGWHRASACASRTSEKRQWYDLTGMKRALLLWPKAQQYKHAVPINEQGVLNNYNLHGLHPKDGIDVELLSSILNSSLVVLSKYQFGRPVGVEGNLKTEIVDINIMLIPDPRKCSAAVRDKIVKAFRNMKNRKVLQLLPERRLREMAYRKKGDEQKLSTLSEISELDMPDRRELDEAVFEMLNIGTRQSRHNLLNELYSYLREFFELTRQKEEKAIANKLQTQKRIVRPRDIAVQIYEEMKQEYPHLLKTYDMDFFDKYKPFDTVEIPSEGKPVAVEDLIEGNGVKFVKRKKTLAFLNTTSLAQADLITLLAESGAYGFVRIPHEESECLRLTDKYRKFIQERDKTIKILAEERTKDTDLQNKILESLTPLMLQPH